MAKPKWITIGTAEGSMNGSSKITAAAYTGRVAREGTITGTTAGGASDTTAVTQVGAAEVITIATKTYSADKVGQSVTIQGKSNSANLSIVAGTSSIPGLVYKLAVAGVADASWDGSKDTVVDGDPGASAIYDFTLTVIVPENKSTSALVAKFAVKNANADVTSGELTINQAAGVKSYAAPVISAFSYPAGNIPASGGSKTPTLSYSQAWGWNNSTTNGGTLSGTLAAPISGTTFKFEGATNTSTGVVTATSKGTTVSEVTEVASVTAKVTLNGKSSAVYKAQTVSQAANTATYGEINISRRVPSANDIPAAGGTVEGSDIIWSDEGSIAAQVITYTSGAKVGITDVDGSTNPTFDPIAITYSAAVTAASKGTAVSAKTEAGVITITATGAGGKKATKTLTIYQAANTATYGAVTIGQATPVSLAAPGETYAIVPALKQTVTYTSGATRTEATPADNKVQLSAEYAVKTAKEGFSLDTNAGKVTVNLNPTTAPREGFVVTISAEGEGGKTATKNITFNQQGSNSTLDLSPDTLSFIAAGETKTLTITSNDSWTLS
jgi:hypothetical protein